MCTVHCAVVHTCRQQTNASILPTPLHQAQTYIYCPKFVKWVSQPAGSGQACWRSFTFLNNNKKKRARMHATGRLVGVPLSVLEAQSPAPAPVTRPGAQAWRSPCRYACRQLSGRASVRAGAGGRVGGGGAQRAMHPLPLLQSRSVGTPPQLAVRTHARTHARTETRARVKTSCTSLSPIAVAGEALERRRRPGASVARQQRGGRFLAQPAQRRAPLGASPGASPRHNQSARCDTFSQPARML